MPPRQRAGVHLAASPPLHGLLERALPVSPTWPPPEPGRGEEGKHCGRASSRGRRRSQGHPEARGTPAGARLPPRTRAFKAPWARAEASPGVKARAHGPGSGGLGLEELGHGDGSVLGTRPAAPAPRPVPRAAQIPPRASPAAPAPPARPASVSRPVRARSPASSWRHNARAPPTAAGTGAGWS